MSYIVTNIKLFFQVFIFSMLPFFELRGSIPYGISQGLNPLLVFLVSVAGNIIVIPLLLFLSKPFINLIVNNKFSKRFSALIMNKITAGSEKVVKYELIGLFVLVAIPLPGTGVWTASAVASFLNLGKRISFFYISMGVIAAGTIMLFLSYFGNSFFK